MSVNTVESWLKRGRRESDTAYARFAVDVDEAREAARAAAMDETEFLSHLNKSVRAGSVQAMKLWWEINGRNDGAEDEQDQPVDPLSEVDELAKRRRAS